MKKCVVIYNPNSGHKEVRRYLPEIEKLIRKKDMM